MNKLFLLWPAVWISALTGGSAAYAHGETVETASAGMQWYTWLFLVFFAATIVFTAWYWIRRNGRRSRLLKAAALLAGTGAVLMGAFNSAGMWDRKEDQTVMNLIHIHGLGYTQDGSKVLLATHDGIKSYEDGHWHQGEGEGHDYMGYAPFEGGFYSSGHPKAGSSLQNPLGLVKSTDEGKTIEILGLHGKVDFHLLAASYRNPVVYAFNSVSNPALKLPGLYRTNDEGKTWIKCDMSGFTGDPTAIAVHPEQGDVVAMGSRNGLFLSRDSGLTFEKLLPDTGISALSFDRDGLLSVGGFKEKPSLLQLDLSGQKIQDIPLPDLKEDAVAFTAHHPTNQKERIVTTYDQDVLLTKDGGETWTLLADNGKTKASPEILPKAAGK